ncbi:MULTISPECIES: KPN_02809 family neutral zinc metallopeptidase [Sporosarcina]|uniref:KPN_02809 family neutral zinc metallopeptidase n=1 Tax=Sporosarcina TaxID=1569 RepID=UPI00058D6272|nr:MULTISPECIES: neutral zinc metallopeptidase [Sporosarcina]WJY27861.1 neutral zinc metallopeptidase [Sporosarcina sp. 0.2-SM1T-5]
MKWRGRRESTNVEDRRGSRGGLAIGGGLGTVVILLVVMFLGGDPSELLGVLSDSGTAPSGQYQETDQEHDRADFVKVVLADTEDVWSEVFAEEGMTYRNPTLVMYTGSVQSACGTASSAVGPFYCPGDEKLYIDLSFYDELKNQFQAPGDFAMAYVIAHEVGHHVQKQLGTSDKMNVLRNRLSKEEYNKYSVRLELQADYFAGVWANRANGMDLLEKGDIQEALRAASAVGDDTIQRRSQGYAVPESFTHGTSKQRQDWFEKGYDNGTIEGGNTFAGLNF